VSFLLQSSEDLGLLLLSEPYAFGVASTFNVENSVGAKMIKKFIIENVQEI
jgi:hypothetical protein